MFFMSAGMDQLTPAMRQYAEQKAQVGDAILFFRMGDFYEMFYEDAKIASKVLGLALTSRNKGENPIPLAGVPYHSAESYIARLVRAGYKVAISEQIEDPKFAKGIVKRKIVRIITPGTLTENLLLEEREGNYLAGCFIDSDTAGISWVELSTGEFKTVLVSADRIIDELVRIRPAELLLPEVDVSQNPVSVRYKKLVREFQEILNGVVTYRPIWWFEKTQAEETLKRQFGTLSLEGFGYDKFDPSLSSAGAILEYLSETQQTTLEHIKKIQKLDVGKFLQLDQTTIRSLEIERTIRNNTRQGSLLDVIDQTINPMGARLLRQWLLFPLRDIDEIHLRQDAVDLLMHRADVLRKIRSELKDFADIERIISRVGIGRASPRDIYALGQSLKKLPKIIEFLEQVKVAGSLLEGIYLRLGGFDELADYLARAIVENPPATIKDGGVIADGFDDELDRLRKVSRDGTSWLAEFQAREIKRTGIPSLKVGFNKVFGYYIEVTNVHKDKIPSDYVRKQTLKNAERYITDELKRYEQEQLTAQERANELEVIIFEQVRSKVASYMDRLLLLSDAIARLDVLCSFAYAAMIRGYCRPEVVTEPVLRIKDGRHPVLDVILAEKFVPNDTELRAGSVEMVIITGPNMAGKSTYIRQVALLTLLAHTGSFIPAKEATIGLTDRIFTRVGASDELTRGQSTFMVEMIEAANILNNATQNSLIILDEIGRGTSTYDGLSLAWAIAEYIADKLHTRTLFATHYHELTELENIFPNIKNFNMLVREWQDEVVFLHKVAEGGADKSYGIHVAKLAGLPKEVIGRARVILAELEQAFSKEAKTPSLAGKEITPSPDLFAHSHMEIIEELKNIDIDQLTPLQALQVLDELKRKVSSS